MQKLIKGVLKDPIGNVLTNRIIRVTNRSTIKEIYTEYLTGSDGGYSFTLNEGWHYIEILFKDVYIWTGDLYIDGSFPSSTSLEKALEYSKPVIIDSIYSLPDNLKYLQDALELGTYTFKREVRDQHIDSLLYQVNLTDSWVSSDKLERSVSTSNEVNTCDASITDIGKVYSDSVGNSFSHKTGSVSTKHGYVSNEVLVSDSITKNNDIKLGNYTYNQSTAVNADSGVHSSLDKLDTSTLSTSTEITNTGIRVIEGMGTTFGNHTTNKILNDVSYEFIEALDNRYKNSLSITDSNIIKGEYFKILGKSSYDIHSNNGSVSERQIMVDKFIVGDSLFEIDSTSNTVHINGSLKVDQLLDSNGDVIGPPSDGDTIFVVSRFSETSTGPWEDELKEYHHWKQDNYSENGSVDPNGWSIAYKFRGEDSIGPSGDTIYYEYNYSNDGVRGWSTSMTEGNIYRRERRVVNGNFGDWSEPARIRGYDGASIEVVIQYSRDGINGWRTTYVIGDRYERRARHVNSIRMEPWSSPISLGTEGDLYEEKLVHTQGVFFKDTDKILVSFTISPEEHNRVVKISKIMVGGSAIEPEVVEGEEPPSIYKEKYYAYVSMYKDDDIDPLETQYWESVGPGWESKELNPFTDILASGTSRTYRIELDANSFGTSLYGNISCVLHREGTSIT